MNFSAQQKLVARWLGCFFAANAIVWMVVATNYLVLLPSYASATDLSWRGLLAAMVFLVTAYLSYFSLIAIVATIVIWPLLLLRSQRLVICIAIILASSLSLYLIIDSIIYHLFHFHFFGIVWPMLNSGAMLEVLALSSAEYLLLAGIFCAVLAVELAIAYIVQRYVQCIMRVVNLKLLFGIIFASWLLSYTLLLQANSANTSKGSVAATTHFISMESQLIPFYNALLAMLIPGDRAFASLQTQGGGIINLQLKQKSYPLNYPLQPLQCRQPKKQLNILWIVIDAMRFDALTVRAMPNLYHLAEKSWQFQQHYSGGNATGPGIFSLFYGLPYNYWTAMQTQQRSPVLVDELQAQGYQMALYRSASMKYPAFHQTLFRHVKPLQLETEGNKAYLRDIKITQQFKQFLNQRNKAKPFFGFLFYDALHNYCQRPTPYPQPFQPTIAVCNRAYLNKESDPKPYWNRYLNAAHFEDNLVAEVLADLKQHGLLKNTVIMVTADHGEEFNDSQENYWGHVSAYTPWQLHVPMIIYWPGQPPQVIDHVSSHYDVAPWFMQQFLGCTSPIGDYSVGHNLLATDNPEFIIANSYIDYAILGKDQVMRIYPQGNYQITDRNGRPLPEAKLDSDHLKLSFEALHRFYARSK